MSQLGDLLELLHGSRGTYRSVRGVLRHWLSFRLSQEAHERWERMLRAAGHSGGTAFQMVMATSAGPLAEPPDRHELVIRFWSEPPARQREETTTLAPQPHEHTVVRDGTRWWTYSPEWGAMSNVAAGADDENIGVGGGELWMALLDPSAWIPALDFQLEGEGDVLGRPALRVRGLPRAPRGDDPFQVHTQLPAGADEYRLLVDRKRGVVLFAAALLEGEEFWVSEFVELVFDEELPAATFVFEPPPGVEIRGPDLGLHEPVTIEEAARRASFPVFYLPELPDGRWELHVTYVAPRERPPLTESVHLAYHRADATRHVIVTERPASEREPEPVPYVPAGPDVEAPAGLEVEEVARAGRSFTVHRPHRLRHGLPLTVVSEREGTAIQLSSGNLEEEVLLELAASMTRMEAR